MLRILLATWLCLAFLTSAKAALAQTIQAYANKTSVVRGQTIAFKVRNATGSAKVGTSTPYTIHRVGSDERPLRSGTVTTYLRGVPANVWANGCGWPTTLNLLIPSSWRSGLYVAHFGSGTN